MNNENNDSVKLPAKIVWEDSGLTLVDADGEILDFSSCDCELHVTLFEYNRDELNGTD